MTWTDPALWHLFRDGDDAFLQRYLAAGQIGGPRLRTRLASELRQVLDGIAALVPTASHVWRGWRSRPLVVIGTLSAKANGWHVERSAAVPRIGICRVDDELRLFADPEVVADFDPVWDQQWDEWKDGMICLPGGFAAPDWQRGGRLHDFLVSVERRIRVPPNLVPPVPQTLRSSLQEPPGLLCVYPRLEQQLPPPAAAEGRPPAPGPRPRPAAARDDAGAEEQQGAAMALPFIGAVYRDTAGNFLSWGPQNQPAFLHWFHNQRPAGSELLSVVSGPTHTTVAKILCDLVTVEANSKQANFFHGVEPAVQPGDAYVYAYFTECQVGWQHVFYIGKGTHALGLPRSEQHIDEALTTDLAPTRKHQGILRGLSTLAGAAGVEPIANHDDFIVARTRLHKHVPPFAPGAMPELVRRAFVFNGPDAGVRAFCTEYHLITSRYGAFNVANETSGNSRTGAFRIISRPRAFVVGNHNHATWWGRACNEFATTATTTAETSALLRIMALEAAVTAFDAHWLAPGSLLNGLVVPATRPAGMAGPAATHLQHVWVGPGAVATANYEVVGRLSANGTIVPVQNPPFRIELRDKKTAPEMRINLRQSAAGAAARRIFVTHVTGAVGADYIGYPIRAPGDPFFKPFAAAANGNKDADFDILAPFNPVGSPVPNHPWPDWHPARSGPHPLQLNIVDAIRAVLAVPFLQ
jgi:hypothetical protein